MVVEMRRHRDTFVWIEHDDIADLVDKGILKRNPGGSKNTSYALV